MASQQAISKSVRKWLQDANLSSHSIDLLILNGYTATFSVTDDVLTENSETIVLVIDY